MRFAGYMGRRDTPAADEVFVSSRCRRRLWPSLEITARKIERCGEAVKRSIARVRLRRFPPAGVARRLGGCRLASATRGWRGRGRRRSAWGSGILLACERRAWSWRRVQATYRDRSARGRPEVTETFSSEDRLPPSSHKYVIDALRHGAYAPVRTRWSGGFARSPGVLAWTPGLPAQPHCQSRADGAHQPTHNRGTFAQGSIPRGGRRARPPRSMFEEAV